MKKFILQGVTPDSHLEAVRHVLSVHHPTRIFISVGFLNQKGFGLISDLLVPEYTTIIAGIRNGITSAQGLLACIDCGCRTFTVDTGSSSILFHPKIYIGRGRDESRLLVGSANLTVGGLHSNIEASLAMDSENREDIQLVAELEEMLDGMIGKFSEHVQVISTRDEVHSLLAAGRVIDESQVSASVPVGSSTDRELDLVPPMNLNNKEIYLGASKPVAIELDSDDEYAQSKSSSVQGDLLWTSGRLGRRDLSIPTGGKTNPTGSMLFTKGQTPDIDQRHYFRESVFGALVWEGDDAHGKEHLERTTAYFRIVIKGIDYGVFRMNLTHDSRTDSRTYLQGNAVTQIHWGEVRDLIATEDLLDRTAYLYSLNEYDLFLLEIS